MQDDAFQKLLTRFDRSWQGYRKVRKGVKKRIGRHMQRLGCPGMDAYLALLDRCDQERRVCKDLLAVSISRFFRDRELWRALEDRAIPAVVRSGDSPLTVWSAGCAGGEEAYSFAIVWDRLKRRLTRPPPLALLASDLLLSNLERAREGTYPHSSLREVGADVRDACFEPAAGRRWRIAPRLKSAIVWLAHDLFSQPPGARFDLIFLRNNLLTYHTDEVKARAAERIVAALSPGGLLVIGAHERLPDSVRPALSVAGHPFVFTKSG